MGYQSNNYSGVAMRRWEPTLIRRALHHPYLTGALIFLVAVLVASPYLLDAYWGNVPIVFYGRVVDEAGNGVGGAEVTMSVIAMKRLSIPVPFASNQTGWLVKAVTSQNGEFVIYGGRGTDLNIVGVKKAGFGHETFGTSSGHYAYSPDSVYVPKFKPNPATPIIFQIRRVAPAR